MRTEAYENTLHECRLFKDSVRAHATRHDLADLKDVMDPYIKRLKEKAAAQPSEAETTIRLSSNDSTPRPSSSTYHHSLETCWNGVNSGASTLHESKGKRHH